MFIGGCRRPSEGAWPSAPFKRTRFYCYSYKQKRESRQLQRSSTLPICNRKEYHTMTKKIDLRSYQRRSTTRQSGFHTNNETTGGECFVRKTERLQLSQGTLTLDLESNCFQAHELFNAGYALLAFGGYVWAKNDTTITISCRCETTNREIGDTCCEEFLIKPKAWTPIGFHYPIAATTAINVRSFQIRMKISTSASGYLDLMCFNMGAVNKKEFSDEAFEATFNQKTKMYIPDIYYFKSDLSFLHFLKQPIMLTDGQWMVFKSCNRCGRFLPINASSELNTISFSLHCKKRAPCVHSTFRAYEIQNPVECKGHTFNTEANKIVSYFGHQLECRPCKKFFVNAPLNPMRDTQQHREDSLRRRALEVLVDKLLNVNTVHMEFKRQKKEFTDFIWRKFNKRCFNCKQEIDITEMALDHTMPLAYLYRMDESATCLCSSCNSQKSDTFPVDFYTPRQLEELSEITGLPLTTLKSRSINTTVLELLKENIVWFFDEFLTEPDYQKRHDNILAADKIFAALTRVIKGKIDLISLYRTKTGHTPTSISPR